MKKKIKEFFYPSRKIFYTAYVSLLILSIIFFRINKTAQHRNVLDQYENYLEKYGFFYDSRFSNEDHMEFYKADGSHIIVRLEFDGMRQFFEEVRYYLSYCDDTLFELVEDLTPDIGINTYRKQLEEVIAEKAYEKTEGKAIWIEQNKVVVYPEESETGYEYEIVIYF